jgi:hypothetical protein
LGSFQTNGKLINSKYPSQSTMPEKHVNLGSGLFNGGINNNEYPFGQLIAQ